MPIALEYMDEFLSTNKDVPTDDLSKGKYQYKFLKSKFYHFLILSAPQCKNKFKLSSNQEPEDKDYGQPYQF